MKRESVDLQVVIAGARVPGGLTREDRVAWIAKAATTLMNSGEPEALFLGGALLSWLSTGGSLERDFLKIAQRGSHRTPARIWRDLASSAMNDTE